MKPLAQGTHGDQAADDGEERRRGKKNAEACIFAQSCSDWLNRWV